MHHQVLLSKEVVPVIEEVGTINGISRCVAEYKENAVTFDIYPDHIRVLRDKEGEFDDVYASDEIYDNLDVSQVIAYLLDHYSKRKLKRGVTVETVMVYTNSPESRFHITTYGNKPIFHEREGLVFQCLEGNCYQAVPTEVVCDLVVSRMGLTIKLFDPKYLIRFEVEGKLIYAPLSAVYQDPIIRDIEHWQAGRHVVGLQWERKKVDLLQMVEDYTSK